MTINNTKEFQSLRNRLMAVVIFSYAGNRLAGNNNVIF